MPSLSTPSQLKMPRRRWRIAFLLGVGVLVNYFDRVNLSVARMRRSSPPSASPMSPSAIFPPAYNWTYAAVPASCRRGAGSIRRAPRRTDQHLHLERRLLRRRHYAEPGRLLRGTAAAGHRGSAHLSGQCKGHRLLVSGKGAQLRHLHLRLRSAKFASAIGVPLIGMLLLKVGWRWSFAATGLISFLYFLLFCLVYRDPDDDPELTAQERDYILEKERRGTGSTRGNRVPRLPVRQHKVIGLPSASGPTTTSSICCSPGCPVTSPPPCTLICCTRSSTPACRG